MGNIIVLSNDIKELIAAGEVIERPASIVKELVENSIDAQANTITVEILKGGINFIRVTDNGIGFLKEDIRTAFLRNATSKVKTKEDLDKIKTLGFRGEALASVCAVSKTELITKHKNDEIGSHIIMESSIEKSFNEANCSVGSTVIVRDLFYNIPARLKFLKSTTTEGLNISNIIDKLAISNPHISFKLIIDNKTKLNTSGNGNMLDAIATVLGDGFSKELIPMEYTHEGMMVKGFITKNTYTRSNRGMQTFFVNSRYVKPKSAIVALEEGYKNTIMVGKFPGCVVNITVPYEELDINIHPSKIDIRFINEKVIFELLYFAVKTTLKNHNMLIDGNPDKEIVLTSVAEDTKGEQIAFIEKKLNYTPIEIKEKTEELISENRNSEDIKPVFTPYEIVESKNIQDKANTDFLNPIINNELKHVAINNRQEKVIDKFIPTTIENNLVHTVQDVSSNVLDDSFRYIGEIFKTYIVIEVNKDVIIIDKHAAHEKIIYDELIEEHKDGLEKQILITPININATKSEFKIIYEYKDALEKIGFSMFEYDTNTLAITAIPSIISGYNITDIILDLIDRLTTNHINIMPDIVSEMFHSIACKKAIKANDNNFELELFALAKKVYKNGDIRFCPHGRPVIIVEKKINFDKRFGRI